jgi:hypothetical protein
MARRTRGGGRSTRGARTGIGLALVLAMAVVASPLRAEPTLAEVLAESPFSTDGLRRLLAGETVAHELREAGNRELAVGAACLRETGAVGEALAPFLGDHPVLPAEQTVATGVLRGDPSPDLFRVIRLEPNVAAEVARYLDAHPGYELNLSAEEIDAFENVDDSQPIRENIQRVHDLLYEALASRYSSYQSRGLDGIADYSRSGGSEASPADELRRSARAAGLKLLAPVFERAWLEYPHHTPDFALETYFWAQLAVDDRAAVGLIHRMGLRDGVIRILGQRSFYVSHFFDAAESILVVAPVAEGTLVLYQDRIWVDRFSGLLASVKKSLGRKFMKARVAEALEKLGVCP